MSWDNYSFIMPGRVVAFDPSDQTATVKLATKLLNNTTDAIDQEHSYANLLQVPVHVVSGGGFSLTVPIKPGDTCVVLFSQFGYDHWLHQDQDYPERIDNGVAPWLRRKFSQKDGLCLVGFNTIPRSISGYSPDDLVLRNTDGTQAIALKVSGDIDVKTPTKVTVDAPVTEWTGTVEIAGTGHKVTGDLIIDGPTSMAGNSLTGLAAPTAASDACTKAYADSLAISGGAVTSVFGRIGPVVADAADYAAYYAAVATTYTKAEVDTGFSTVYGVLAGKANTTHNQAASTITSGTFANARVAASNVTQHNAVIAPTWANVSGKPSTFAPSAHTHLTADITDFNILADATPELGGDLDANRKFVTDLRGATYTGRGAIYAAIGDFTNDMLVTGTREYTLANQVGVPFLGIPDGTVIPPVLFYDALNVMDQNMFILGGGALFYNYGTVTNKVGRASTNLSGVYALVDQMTYLADTNACTMAGAAISLLSDITVNVNSTGTLDGTNAIFTTVFSSMTLGSASVTNIGSRTGLAFNDATGAGTILRQAGVCVNSLTKASVVNAAIAFGGSITSIASGNWGLIQSDEQKNKLNGALETKIRTVSAGRTLDYTDHTVEYTGASAANFPLPLASTCKGRTYTMVGTGAGDMSLVPSGSDKVAGVAATYVMNAGAGQFKSFQSNGIDNWMRIA